MISLNLLPDVKKEFIHAQRMRAQTITIAIVVSIASIGLTVLLVAYVFVVQPGRSYAEGIGIEKKTSQLNEIEDLQKFVNLQNQLAAIDDLHAKKGNYARLLDYLPKLNPAQNPVSLNEVEIFTETKTITIQGNVKDFASLKVFESTLANAQLRYQQGDEEVNELLFSSVETVSAGISQTGADGAFGVGFEISLEYNEKAFDKTVANPTVTIPKQNTTQSAVDTPTFGGNLGDD